MTDPVIPPQSTAGSGGLVTAMEGEDLPVGTPVTAGEYGLAPASPPSIAQGTTPRRTLRARDKFLWMWPVVALAIMAGVGMLWGSLGTFISGVIVIAVLVLFVGDEVLEAGHRLAVTVLAVLLVVIAWLGHQLGVPFFSTRDVKVNGTESFSAGSAPADFRGRKLSADDLKGVNLHGALLSGATLDGLDLHGMDLSGVKGQGASFRRAILDRARLDEADLRGADLREACLYGAVLRRADLRGVDATGADTTDVVADAKAVKQAAAWPAEGTGRNCGR
ncbi:pentapeptide repeat-containing protein [Microbispora sp. NBRC 16548]|uniref:pentapeptide repeat-containing protein n=1 Tax=Microbispora sp. NBRC 16548 TaxID=3030994 RepID=UPI0024A387AA|nr:pentapeptide repeat-containing protein [Microbispora sp. NBRC 16548]GLX03744.1 hypothetical protein Misp03_06710 [Microbispora sp. NBRC 16548]